MFRRLRTKLSLLGVSFSLLSAPVLMGQAALAGATLDLIISGIGKVVEATSKVAEMKQVVETVQKIRDASKMFSTYSELVADTQYLAEYYEATHARLVGMYNELQVVSNLTDMNYSAYASALRSYYQKTDNMFNNIDTYLRDVGKALKVDITRIADVESVEVNDEGEQAVQKLDEKIKDCIKMFDGFNDLIDNMADDMALDYQAVTFSGFVEEMEEQTVKGGEEKSAVATQQESRETAGGFLSVIWMILGFVALLGLVWGAFKFYTSDQGFEQFVVRYLVFLVGSGLILSVIAKFI